MRHNVAGRLFGRTANQRKALLRGLVSALIEHERIETTMAKAKETRRLAEKMVTLGKKGSVHAKRLAMSKIPNRDLVVKLFDEIAPRFADRNGGYTRIVPTRRRVNDRAELAVLEFVDYEDNRAKPSGDEAPAKKESKKATSKKKEAPKKEKAAPKEEKVAAEEKKEEKAEKKPAAKKKTSAKKTATKKTASSAKKTTAKKTTAKKTSSKKKTEE